MMRISVLYKGVFVIETLYNSEDPGKSYENLNFLLLSLFFKQLFLLVTGSQLSQCLAVRNSVVFLTKTRTKAWLSDLGRENSNLLYCEVFFIKKNLATFTFKLVGSGRNQEYGVCCYTQTANWISINQFSKADNKP